MLGIILTLFAVLLVICFAFYYSDHPSSPRADVLSYIGSRVLRRNSAERRNPHDAGLGRKL